MNAEVQYITDTQGQKKSVILDIAEYERMMEDFSDLASVAERSNEECVPMDAFLKDLKKDGIL